MKTNEAPDKIYVTECMLFMTNPEITLQGNGNKIEYTRTDVFIEKACELLARMVWEVTYEDLEGNSVNHYDKMEFIEDFKNYMKGE